MTKQDINDPKTWKYARTQKDAGNAFSGKPPAKLAKQVKRDEKSK